MKNIIWLTSPEGIAYFNAEKVIAVTRCYIPVSEKESVNSQVYLERQEQPFNIIEEPEVVLQRIDAVTTASLDSAKQKE